MTDAFSNTTFFPGVDRRQETPNISILLYRDTIVELSIFFRYFEVNYNCYQNELKLQSKTHSDSLKFL